ncbi:MAG: retron system putative HNH endonuclease [Bacteroidales bacterium]
MRLIRKNSEPSSWKIYRQTPGVDYASSPELRQSLYAEQGGICAYCMQRLLDEPGGNYLLLKGERLTNRVEHLKSREEHPDKKLDYSNMVLCCCGKSFKQELHKHCDQSKGSKSISFSPMDPFFVDTLSYSSHTGEIKSSHSTYNEEVTSKTILNLNNVLLKENRHLVLRGLITHLNKKKWTLARLQEMRDKWDTKDSKGLYKPYCGMIIWYLDQKLKAYKRKSS